MPRDGTPRPSTATGRSRTAETTEVLTTGITVGTDTRVCTARAKACGARALRFIERTGRGVATERSSTRCRKGRRFTKRLLSTGSSSGFCIS